MQRQPFVLDGATVMLVRAGETPNFRAMITDYLVHVALHRYPVELRKEKTIQGNCCGFGDRKSVV